MKIDVITLFPDLIESYLSDGVIRRGIEKNLLEVATLSPRKFTSDVHQTVDDSPFGGGDGMVLKPEPIADSIESLDHKKKKVVYLSPAGKVWTDKLARDWAVTNNDLILIAGRYAGLDQRVIDEYVDEEISVGDYVLSGGELPALILIDSIARFIPGVLGNNDSAVHDSFAEGLLEAPQYTRPREFGGKAVPEFLLSGDHQKIAKLRRAQAILLTSERRPDLMSDPSQIAWAKEVLEKEKA